MNAIPTRPSAYTVALSSHQNTSGVAACSKPTTTPHNIGARSSRDEADELIAERDKVWTPSAMRVHPLADARLDATASSVQAGGAPATAPNTVSEARASRITSRAPTGEA